MLALMHKGVFYALLAATLFGASTPLAKILVGQIAPIMLAGLLYLGSGLGLLTWFSLSAVKQKGQRAERARLAVSDLPWLGGAILSGGIIGPILLMFGLTLIPASTASLLLNMEGVLTALMAWFVFKENFDRRILLGMALIVVAGVLLSCERRPELSVPWGALAIVAACLCWAIDNNLTRKVSASDAVQIAGVKGLIAGSVNLSLALTLGLPAPEINITLVAGVVGFCGYGLSLVMFVLALRHLGAARTGAYFSVAPFVGAISSIFLFQDMPGALFWSAAVLMAVGIWLHLTEEHGHFHAHKAMSHAHDHAHDEHHQHAHDFPWEGKEPHAHEHQHESLTHLHTHFPDIHHRHTH
jgi:drug/metabolite transporter (DMT)-like permease